MPAPAPDGDETEEGSMGPHRGDPSVNIMPAMDEPTDEPSIDPTGNERIPLKLCK